MKGERENVVALCGKVAFVVWRNTGHQAGGLRGGGWQSQRSLTLSKVWMTAGGPRAEVWAELLKLGNDCKYKFMMGSAQAEQTNNGRIMKLG